MKNDLIRALLAFIAIGAVCYGLAAARPPSSSAQMSSPGGSGGDQIVMRVNGEAITEREFNAFLVQAPEQMQFYYATPEGRRMLADEVVKLKALEQEGIRLGIHKDKDVSTRLDLNRTTLVAGSTLRKMVGSPTEQRLRAEYEKQKPQLESSELSHILIAHQGSAIPPRSGQPIPVNQAMAKARRVVASLKAGTDFELLARAESDDVQSAQTGGSLGVVPPGSLPPQLQGAVAALQPGQVSDPVRSEFGIHIFKAGERRAQEFEVVREALVARIQRDEAEAAVDKLQKTAKVELDPKFFPPPKAQPAPQQPAQKPKT